MKLIYLKVLGKQIQSYELSLIQPYLGEENRMTFQEIYTKTFQCVYELQLYPFDTQVVFKKNLNLSEHLFQ